MKKRDRKLSECFESPSSNFRLSWGQTPVIPLPKRSKRSKWTPHQDAVSRVVVVAVVVVVAAVVVAAAVVAAVVVLLLMPASSSPDIFADIQDRDMAVCDDLRNEPNIQWSIIKLGSKSL